MPFYELVMVLFMSDYFNSYLLFCFTLKANIHSIMGSEDQVMELMVLLDKGLQEAMQIEEQLDEYESKLQVNTYHPDS